MPPGGRPSGVGQLRRSRQNVCRVSKTIGGGTKIDNSNSRRVRMPALYSIAIYDRHGTPLFFREWSRPQGVKDMREEHKLMFGFLFSLKQLVGKMSPKKYAPCFTPRKKGVAFASDATHVSNLRVVSRGGGFHACSTSAYRLHYFETASGLRFVLTTDLAAVDMREALRHIYAQIYVECLTKNPLYTTGEPISCPLFTQTLDRFTQSLQ